MKLITTHATGRLNSFDVRDNGQKLLTLTFNPSLGTTRFEYGNNRRMFMMDKQGFPWNRVALKNEYGITMGYLGHEKWHTRDEGFIQIDNEKFFYYISHEQPVGLVIYKNSKEEPLLVCSLADISDHPTRIDKAKSLLMTLAWYLLAHEEHGVPATAPAPATMSY